MPFASVGSIPLGRRPLTQYARYAINLRQVEAFNAVMETGSFTAAAERLFVTQPAISRLVRDFEEHIGYPLFERNKGRILPTVEARSLHEIVQRSLIGIDTIAAKAQEIGAFKRGSLSIAAMPAIALQFLPRVLTAFSATYDGITVSLQIRSSVKVAEWIGAQQADFGISSEHTPMLGTEGSTLCSGPLVAILPRGHRLAGQRSVDPCALAGESLIALGTELPERQRIEKAFAKAGVPLRIRIEVQISTAICAFVRAGAGLGLVDPISAYEHAGHDLVAIPFEPDVPFIYRKLLPTGRTRPLFLEAFCELLDAELRQNPFLDVPG